MHPLQSTARSSDRVDDYVRLRPDCNGTISFDYDTRIFTGQLS
jgi:hypothetical protein